MQWPRRARLFGIRLAICLVLLGAAYIALFGLRPVAKPALITPTQKLASLRAALDESYLAGNSLAGFSQSDGAAFQSLDNSRLQFEKATNRLQTALSAAPPATIAPFKPALVTVIDRSHQATQSYRAHFAVLAQPISYNPSADLGALALDTDFSKVATRASAAQKGLLKAADNQTTVTATASGLSVQNENGPASLLEQTTRTVLRAEAACLGQLSAQASAQQTVAATQTRAQCIDGYPALRLAAIQNVTQTAWSSDYQSYMQRTVPALLRQLDQLIKSK